jgi:hypothetical protein
MGCGASSNKVCPVVLDEQAVFGKKLAEVESAVRSINTMLKAMKRCLAQQERLVIFEVYMRETEGYMPPPDSEEEDSEGGEY